MKTIICRLTDFGTIIQKRINMRTNISNILRRRARFVPPTTWLMFLVLLPCYGGLTIFAQDIRKLEEINFKSGTNGSDWRNPDTKLSKEVKLTIEQANKNVKDAILKGDQPKPFPSGDDDPTRIYRNFGRVHAVLHGFADGKKWVKDDAPGCHITMDIVDEAMKRLDYRLKSPQVPADPTFQLYCLPKCTGPNCGPQNTVTFRFGSPYITFQRRPEIWIRDTSPEALQGSYAGTIRDPREQKIALIIHMYGRIAHEANGGEFFYSLGGQKPAAFSRALSPLAATSKRMFVAEVFTATVMQNLVKDIDGQRVGHFTPEIMTEYTHLRGLRWWQ